ncbi:MAG TPA: enolase C-terminal domain-like protein [Kofleriaceae bacterium]
MRIVAAASRVVSWPIASRGAARGRTERAAVLLELTAVRSTLDDPELILERLPRPARLVGLGEAAPLPGMSIDALADAAHDLAELARRVPFELSDTDEASVFAAGAARAPSARFAIETALFDLLAREHDRSIAQLFTPRLRAVPLSAVVDTADEAARAVAAGMRSLKLKLGADDDLERVAQIAAAAPGVRLRIDGNGTWRRRDVADRLAQLAQLPIDYVEEPCGASHELLDEPLACKLALDESLTGLLMSELRPALASPALAAVVLKPTLLGGLTPALVIAQLARASGVAAVVSHALEGPIGTAACAELALVLGGDVAVGLAPHGGLTGWRLAVPQLAADRVQPASYPGLGFLGLDLAGALAACPGAPR